MAVNTVAFLLHNPKTEAGVGAMSSHGPGAMYPEMQPLWLWGQGTPDGDREPFLSANKGSFYAQVDATDDASHVWEKVDEGGDNDDWVSLAGPVNPTHVTQNGALFDISAADSEQVVLHAKAALTITKAYLLWNEATAASGAAEGDITIGVTTGGNEVVAATAYTVSKATGSVSNL